MEVSRNCPEYQVTKVKDGDCLTDRNDPACQLMPYMAVTQGPSCFVTQCPSGHFPVAVRVQGLRSQICSRLFIYRGRRVKWKFTFPHFFVLKIYSIKTGALFWLLRPAHWFWVQIHCFCLALLLLAHWFQSTVTLRATRAPPLPWRGWAPDITRVLYSLSSSVCKIPPVYG